MDCSDSTQGPNNMDEAELDFRLKNIMIRMSVVVHGRELLERLLGEVEAGSPRMSEDLRTAIAAARKHLRISEELEEVEDRLRRAGIASTQIAAHPEARSLAAQASNSWREWQLAYANYHGAMSRRAAGEEEGDDVAERAKEEQGEIAHTSAWLSSPLEQPGQSNQSNRSYDTKPLS